MIYGENIGDFEKAIAELEEARSVLSNAIRKLRDIVDDTERKGH